MPLSPHHLLAAVLALTTTGAQALCLSPLCSCSVSTVALVLGSYNPLAGTAADATGSVALACRGLAGVLIGYDIALGPGLHAGGQVLSRRLSSGSAALAYGLYQDAGRSVLWGDASGGSLVRGTLLLNLLGLSPATTHPVYGRVPGGQTGALPGQYLDTVTVTVSYQ